MNGDDHFYSKISFFRCSSFGTFYLDTTSSDFGSIKSPQPVLDVILVKEVSYFTLSLFKIT
jgi:hypothetical protein